MKDQNGELPLGFAMGLAQNPAAMENFSKLTESQKEIYISKSKQVNSKSEMQELISGIGNSENYSM